MQRISDWLAARTPPPPQHLAARLKELASDRQFNDPAELSSQLVSVAEELLTHIGDDRAAATDLLAADALITYAMEAAAESCEDVGTIAAQASSRIAGVVPK